MESHFKKRLIGAIFTVMLIAIALPNVLNWQRQEKQASAPVPAMPSLPEWSDVNDREAIRQQAAELLNGQAQSKMTAPAIKVEATDVPAPKDIAPTKAGSDASGLPYAWTLQLGAFKDQRNAHALRDDLRAKGFKAYVQVFDKEGLVRVYVGPELTRARIESLQKRLRTTLRQNDIVITRFHAR